jgi:hypothetical protein
LRKIDARRGSQSILNKGKNGILKYEKNSLQSPGFFAIMAVSKDGTSYLRCRKVNLANKQGEQKNLLPCKCAVEGAGNYGHNSGESVSYEKII